MTAWSTPATGGPGPHRTRATRATRHPFAAAFAGVVILVGCVFASFVLPAPAWAHDSLTSSSPADGAEVRQAPSVVTLKFTEAVGRKFSFVAVSGPDSKQVQVGSPEVSGTTVTQRLRPLAAAGVYRVAWRVVSADGHPVSGTFQFRVLSAGTSPDAGTATPTPSGTPRVSGTPTATGSPSPSQPRDQTPDPAATSGSDQAAVGGNASAWPVAGAVLGVVALAGLGAVVLRRRTQSRQGSSDGD
ncbi:copper resistance CopC family protein [Actinopolymorpha alba]|uniref:copper resistance CopC family protein n=1 Tax=Actinopolymorpha alba TaxID=533267 RepID=UPI00037FCF35|nr:copper resistance protein CopC [Actinopolymorpha alba]